MHPPPSSDFPIRPQGRGALLFQGKQHRYEYLRTLLEHEDFSPTAVARRKPLRGDEPTCVVMLRRIVMPPRKERRQRALEEVRLACHLDHPNIARVFGLEEHEGRPYVVTEYVAGCFLDTAIAAALLERRKLSPAFACYIAAEVADALHHAWNCKGEGDRPLHVVHRAVSPMSIRLGRQGEVKLTDFGVAWSELTGRVHTAPRVLRADLAYAAPEIMRFHPADGRADLFSLGMVLLEMLAGRYPLDPPDLALPQDASPEVVRYNAITQSERTTWASVGQLAERILHFDSEDVERMASGIPAQLKHILHKALRADPGDRYQSGAELSADLRSYLHQDRPFGKREAATEVISLICNKTSPHATHAFPTEKGVVPVPEEDVADEM
ncbi:MAG TPA: serine/threonine-protein kinase [Archangium sp.]|uniref:serine/threonine protein kinase n=1 Tax=Archangium sp. TaxID=1872627 RepID=UPI002E34A651|nr:serine/threonine-protein kinase [Archangium sp.]HEX5751106.1 serine/threonine-protein kinase [Archangium sp.]